MKKFILILVGTLVLASCTEKVELIDNTKLELVGSKWRVFDEKIDFSPIPEIVHDYKDIYEVLHFHAETVSIYKAYENGDVFSMFPEECDYTYSKDKLTISRNGTTYSGSRSGNTLNVFGKSYNKQ